ncbi:1-deoxy-D-xylulose-5-phosphate synthase [Limnohabitans sp.]|uniref:1-deoxy-D-xylulose-5-phosphate synthase n=1 Tax=Limnohabitans sp. TaxID=1907725 RepID=UPI003342C9D1
MDALLEHIQSPSHLRKLSRESLKGLSIELRERLIETVSQTGGHFSSNLGTVELTLALHYVFNTPEDRLVWDVGHQTYAHKILTGRNARMGSLRQLGGLSGFPRREESIYDAFGTAHSSTSISAALGMAAAAKLTGSQRKAVAIIGDGALTAGMAYEALNNAGTSNCDVLVILNDNDMSISPPVGALNQYLAELMSGRFYAEAKKLGGQMLRNAPPLFALARHLEQQTQTLIQSNTIFEKLGFTYTGPIDGHDVDGLVVALEKLFKAKGPQFLHVVTRKGKGYEKAEIDPITYHGPGKFNPSVGVVGAVSTKLTFTQVFGQWLCDAAAKDPRLVAITPAMREGSGMVEFSQRFPNRYHDVGIAEQHAVTFAAGLACEGLKPVVAIYSTFLQRAYDQLIHDVALQNLPVVFALDRAGLVGADGPTHAGMFDIAFVRCIPNMSVACPADENECRQLLSSAYAQDHPVTVRYPRGAGVGVELQKDLAPLPFGKAQVVRQGEGLAILCFGPLLYEAQKVAQSLNATVVNMRWAKPLDLQTLREIAQSHDRLVTLEDGTRMGGAGSAVLEALQDMKISSQVLIMGFEDEFTEHGDPGLLMQQYGLTATGIQRGIEAHWPMVQVAPSLRRVV